MTENERTLADVIIGLHKRIRELEKAAGQKKQAKGGHARAERLTPERRREIAMLGVAARKRKRTV